MSNSNSGNVLLALLTGAAIGAGVGILYAPDKGTKTRKKLKRKAKEAQRDLNTRLSNAKDQLAETAESKKADFEQKLEDTISNMSYKADDIITTLEAKLEDLRRKNAQFQKGETITPKAAPAKTTTSKPTA